MLLDDACVILSKIIRSKAVRNSSLASSYQTVSFGVWILSLNSVLSHMMKAELALPHE